MSITRTSNQSWFSRIGGSIKGVLFGGLLFIVAFPVLFINEGRAVRTAKGLAEGSGAVVNIDSDNVDSSNEGKFVHLNGTATTDEMLRDEQFGVEVNGIRLIRHVEMYQWEQHSSTKKKKKLGGGTKSVTTYTYDKTWKSSLSNSGNFEEPTGHENPSSMPFQGNESTAKKVHLGAFKLSDSLISKIRRSEPVKVDESKIPQEMADRAKISADGSGKIYIKNQSNASVSVDVDTSSEPNIGDMRIWFSKTPNSDVSVMSKQFGDGFEPYKTHAGTNLHMLSMGNISAEEMIAKAEADNVMLTWLLRALGCAMMCIGIALALRPLAVIGDVVPIVGSIVGTGTTLVAILIGAGFAFCTISLAWLFYRPLIGIPLLILGIGLIVVIVRMVMGNKNQPQSAPLQVELAE